MKKEEPVVLDEHQLDSVKGGATVLAPSILSELRLDASVLNRLRFDRRAAVGVVPI
jgi:hypothetical protein